METLIFTGLQFGNMFIGFRCFDEGKTPRDTVYYPSALRSCRCDTGESSQLASCQVMSPTYFCRIPVMPLV